MKIKDKGIRYQYNKSMEDGKIDAADMRRILAVAGDGQIMEGVSGNLSGRKATELWGTESNFEADQIYDGLTVTEGDDLERLRTSDALTDEAKVLLSDFLLGRDQKAQLTDADKQLAMDIVRQNSGGGVRPTGDKLFPSLSLDSKVYALDGQAGGELLKLMQTNPKYKRAIRKKLNEFNPTNEMLIVATVPGSENELYIAIADKETGKLSVLDEKQNAKELLRDVDPHALMDRLGAKEVVLNELGITEIELQSVDSWLLFEILEGLIEDLGMMFKEMFLSTSEPLPLGFTTASKEEKRAILEHVQEQSQIRKSEEYNEESQRQHVVKVVNSSVSKQELQIGEWNPTTYLLTNDDVHNLTNLLRGASMEVPDFLESYDFGLDLAYAVRSFDEKGEVFLGKLNRETNEILLQEKPLVGSALLENLSNQQGLVNEIFYNDSIDLSSIQHQTLLDRTFAQAEKIER